MQSAECVLQCCIRDLVVVIGSHVFDLRLRHIQLGLGDLHNRSEPEVVPPRGERQRELGLIHQLHRNRNPLIRGGRSQPRRFYIVFNLLLEVAQALIGG